MKNEIDSYSEGTLTTQDSTKYTQLHNCIPNGCKRLWLCATKSKHEHQNMDCALYET